MARVGQWVLGAPGRHVEQEAELGQRRHRALTWVELLLAGMRGPHRVHASSVGMS